MVTKEALKQQNNSSSHYNSKIILRHQHIGIPLDYTWTHEWKENVTKIDYELNELGTKRHLSGVL